MNAINFQWLSTKAKKHAMLSLEEKKSKIVIHKSSKDITIKPWLWKPTKTGKIQKLSRKIREESVEAI